MVQDKSTKLAKTKTNLPQKVVERILVHFHEEMLGGVPDQVISDETGIPLRRVEDYRRERVVKRRRRHKRVLSKERAQYQTAISLFGDDVAPEFVTRVESPALNHRWEPPTFVRRKPLNYDSMCFGMYQLYRFGMGIDRLAKAFGFLEEDIEDAISVYSSYLERSGVLCPLCRLKRIDPLQQYACVPNCVQLEKGQK